MLFRSLFELVLSYEAANWDAITRLATELGIPDNLLTNIYFSCMENVEVLWDQLTNVYANQLPPEEEEEEQKYGKEKRFGTADVSDLF